MNVSSEPRACIGTAAAPLGVQTTQTRFFPRTHPQELDEQMRLRRERLVS